MPSGLECAPSNAESRFISINLVQMGSVNSRLGEVVSIGWYPSNTRKLKRHLAGATEAHSEEGRTGHAFTIFVWDAASFWCPLNQRMGRVCLRTHHASQHLPNLHDSGAPDAFMARSSVWVNASPNRDDMALAHGFPSMLGLKLGHQI